MSDADITALVAMLRHIQCDPASFDTYSMASAAERAADAIERLRLSGGASEPPTNSVSVSSLLVGGAPEPSETLYTAKDVEALFAIRDAAVAAHTAKPVATAWMNGGVMENAFPRAPRTPEEWAQHDSDGYWSAKGYSELPLYFGPPSPPEPGGKPVPCWCAYCGEPHSPKVQETDPRISETKAGES